MNGHPHARDLPARAVLRETGLHVAMAGIGRAELHDPFLQDTLRRVPAGQSLVHVPDPEAVEPDAASAPAGLVFHVARCGSTLVSQLLKLQPGLTVYSEPLAINELLVPPHADSRARMVGSLRALGSLFSRHAGGAYVLKLSSWNLLFCDLIAEAFPHTPWVLSLRDPLEVCVSLQARPPAWLRDVQSGPFKHAIRWPDGDSTSAEARLASVFAAFCDAARRLPPRQGVLLPYESLPGAVWRAVLPHFGMQADEQAIASMLHASRSHAKSPAGQATPFVDDAQSKRAAAGDDLRRAVDEWARPALNRLRAAMPAGAWPTAAAAG